MNATDEGSKLPKHTVKKMKKLTDDEFYKKLKESVKMLSSLIECMEEDGNASIEDSERDFAKSFESDFGCSKEQMMDGMGNYPEEDNRYFGLNYDANGDSI